MMYSKDREIGGWSTYARGYGEGIMAFTYNKERKMIPVWIPRYKAIKLAMTVLQAFNYRHWTSSEQEDEEGAFPDTYPDMEPTRALPEYCPHESCLKIFVSEADPTAFDCRRCLGDDFPSRYLRPLESTAKEES